MGNSASSSRAHHDNTVDYGFLVPQGVYTANPDWNQQIVTQLIVERRLAPFYRPLEDYEEDWDDEQILAARKQLPERDSETIVTAGPRSDQCSNHSGSNSLGGVSRSSSVNMANRRPGALKEPSRIPEAMVYRGAVECPICFLYYPPNINHSRCCDQAICTECFVQIKRSEPTTTHLVSEPAACPYCVQDNFGVTYTPPSWRAGLGADGSHSPIYASSRTPSQQSIPPGKTRRKSFGADSAEVVTIDQIRPDWEAKLAAVRAQVQRRANRRIIMRQVGDRLIPVGVTSGRIHPLTGEALAAAGGAGGEGMVISIGGNPTENGGEATQGGRGSRRSRRRQHQQAPQEMNGMSGLFNGMAIPGQDLEELMIMEAMRLSLLEHEEYQRKEEEKKKKEEAERAAKSGGGEASGSSGEGSSNTNTHDASSSTVPSLALPDIPITSPIDVSKPQAVEQTQVSGSLGLGPSSHDSRGSSPFGGPSSLNAAVTTADATLGVSSVHSPPDSRTHSRSNSATPSLRAVTPQLRESPEISSTPSLSLDGAESVPTGSVEHGTGSNQVSVPDEERDLTTKATARPDASKSAASLVSENPTYNELPSSPDEPARRPLLQVGPSNEETEHEE